MHQHLNKWPLDPGDLTAFIRIVSPIRAEHCGDWMRVGWCLHNINTSLLPLWIEFSKKSKKYKAGECETLWHTMENRGLGLGSLHMWAREDNPEEYVNIMNTHLCDILENCPSTDHDVARVASIILKDRFICASSSGQSWYEFTGTFWKEDKHAINMRKEFSTTVRNHSSKLLAKLAVRSSARTATEEERDKQTCE